MPFDLGDVVPLSAESRNTAGVLVNATTITLTITLPDGTTATPAVTNPPSVTGVYTLDYTPAQAGRHLVRWVGTGTNVFAYTDSFDVRTSTPPLFFSLADARAVLNLTSTTQDSLVRDLIESTTASVEHLIGPVIRQTVTERHEGGWYTLALRQPPVISVQTMVPILTGGTTYTTSEVDIDGATGIVTLLTGDTFDGPLRVTYTAGITVTPAAVRDAARIVLKHLWRSRNGVDGLPGLSPPADYGESYVPGLGYALPDAALQLLNPYIRGPMV